MTDTPSSPDPNTDVEESPQTGFSRRKVIAAMGAGAGAMAVIPHVPHGAARPIGTGALSADHPKPPPNPDPNPDPVQHGEVSPPVQDGEFLTTNMGTRIADDQNTLRAGSRGPALLEDFHFREKMTHFDHERIPERVVHARGVGAHGVFRVYEPLGDLTSAALFQEPSKETPVFVRFSTVNGSRGSSDLARDARGFAVKFYTSAGIWDLVGNNMPVFFIQDAIKFPDLVHAFKPEPHDEIPQASTAHDNFWDFISLTPESLHMIMWVMSDRALPRSLRMMDGFGVHTFRLVSAKGEATYVKFHWRSLLGAHSIVWDEAQKISGVDPDFHRRDLWDAIAAGQFPEYELGIQTFTDDDAKSFDFDFLDATKLVPEDVIPVRPIGRMTLNRNPDNYFTETEQVAFHLGHVVPGIDFTDDPLLQGRLFSYLDTQINRFGGPNFHQLPINQSKSPVNNYQQDSPMRYANLVGRVNYEPNSLGGTAREAKPSEGGYVTFPQPVNGPKVRVRSQSFADYNRQARLFWNSMTEPEKMHIVQALQFELSKVGTVEVKQRMLELLATVDGRLTTEVASALGLPAPSGNVPDVGSAKGLSQMDGRNTAATRKVAILAADGVKGSDVAEMKNELAAAGLVAEVVAPHLGTLTSSDGPAVTVDQRFGDVISVLYDSVFVPGGKASTDALAGNADAVRFVREAFKHYKPLGASGEGAAMITSALRDVVNPIKEPGVVTGGDADSVAKSLIAAIAQHRFWDRATAAAVPV